MTTKAELRDLTAGILMGQTVAGDQVYTPSDWPTWSQEYPVILVRAPHEEKESLGRATVEFTVVATIQIVARVELFADVADLGGEVAEEALEQLGRRIERLVINNPVLMTRLQQFSFVRSRQGFSAEGEKHLGELTVEIGMEFYQGPEDFFDLQAPDLLELDVHLDTGRPFDANGVYLDPPFPAAVTPAPRTAGPDGRDEGALKFTFEPSDD